MKKIVFSFLTATSLIATPQAVVFDFGGVMTGEANREAVVQFVRGSFGLSAAEFQKVNSDKHLALKQGATEEEFWLSYAQEKGIELPATWTGSFRSVVKNAMGINPAMYALVEQLREERIPVAMLSNIDRRLSILIRSFGFYEPFAPCLLSCDIGVEKPDPRAYELLLTRLNLPAEGVVFIDDRPENIEAAKKLGLDAILFESEQQLRIELSKRGVSP